MTMTAATRPAIQSPARASRGAAAFVMPMPDVGALDPAVVATVGKGVFNVLAGTVPKSVDCTGVENPMDTLVDAGGSAVENVAVVANTVDVRAVVTGVVTRVLVVVNVPPLIVEGGGATPPQILPFGQHPPESQ